MEEKIYTEDAASEIAGIIESDDATDREAVEIVNSCEVSEEPVYFMEDLETDGRKYSIESFAKGYDYENGQDSGFDIDRNFFTVREGYAMSFDDLDPFIADAAKHIAERPGSLKECDISDSLRRKIEEVLDRIER